MCTWITVNVVRGAGGVYWYVVAIESAMDTRMWNSDLVAASMLLQIDR